MSIPPDVKTLMIGGVPYETHFTAKFEARRKFVAPDPKRVLCVIPGLIQKVYVQKGSRVRRDDHLLVLEAMKMQNDVLSPTEGIIRAVHVGPGDLAMKGEVLIEFE